MACQPVPALLKGLIWPLGLDVIVNILGNLNGTASVRSEPDSGTVIRVVIPLEDKA